MASGEEAVAPRRGGGPVHSHDPLRRLVQRPHQGGGGRGEGGRVADAFTNVMRANLNRVLRCAALEDMLSVHTCCFAVFMLLMGVHTACIYLLSECIWCKMRRGVRIHAWRCRVCLSLLALPSVSFAFGVRGQGILDTRCNDTANMNIRPGVCLGLSTHVNRVALH